LRGGSINRVIKTIFQNARDRQHPPPPPFVNLHFKKFDPRRGEAGKSSRAVGPRGESIEGCKEREEICRGVKGAKGMKGMVLFTAACSVIRIFTIAAAEPGRDSFGRR